MNVITVFLYFIFLTQSKGHLRLCLSVSINLISPDFISLLSHVLYVCTGTNDQYEIGDLSGKYGSFLNLTSYSETHVDYNLPLFGKNSIQGRSIVIHKQKTMGSGRWVCAVIGLTHEEGLFVMATKVTFVGPALQGYILLVSHFCFNVFT